LLNGALDLLRIRNAGIGLGSRPPWQKFGMAIAASKPMMATTIMISTSVNADCGWFWLA